MTAITSQNTPAETTRRLARRKRVGAAFQVLTIVPVVLAIGLIVTLLVDVLTDTVSWQIVEPSGSGAHWSFVDGFRAFGTWDRVMYLELEARGEDPGATLDDPEERRKWGLRNRVELTWWIDGTWMRWQVTSTRDDPVDTFGLLDGWNQRTTLLADLEEGQYLKLNPWLDAAFFTKNASRSPIMAGLLAALLGTLWVIGLVIAIALPIGVGTAVYLEEYAREGWFARFVEVNIRNLAGVPSIVYGILGLYMFVRLANFGPTILSAAFTLALLILPVVIIASREAIRGVPSTLRQASYGLGATKWQTVSRIVLPNAASGIVTGMILAVARAIGETAPLCWSEQPHSCRVFRRVRRRPTRSFPSRSTAGCPRTIPSSCTLPRRASWSCCWC